MLGASARHFFENLRDATNTVSGDRLHFVTMREMTNIALAACDGKEGNPNEYRDYRLKMIRSMGKGVLEQEAVSQVPVRPA